MFEVLLLLHSNQDTTYKSVFYIIMLSLVHFLCKLSNPLRDLGQCYFKVKETLPTKLFPGERYVFRFFILMSVRRLCITTK